MVMEETFIQIHQAILFIKGEPVVFSDLIKIVMSLLTNSSAFSQRSCLLFGVRPNKSHTSKMASHRSILNVQCKFIFQQRNNMLRVTDDPFTMTLKNKFSNSCFCCIRYRCHLVTITM